MSPRVRVPLAAGAIIAAAAVAIGVFLLFAISSSDGENPDNAGSSADGWIRSTRAANDPARVDGQLNVCVQSIDVDLSLDDEMKPIVETTIAKIAESDRDWAQWFPQRSVHVGCPYAPAMDSMGLGRNVDAPSHYRTFVFILPAERVRDYSEWAMIAQHSSALVAPEERLCDGDVCGQETYGLYLTPEAVRDPARIEYELYYALWASWIEDAPSPEAVP